MDGKALRLKHIYRPFNLGQQPAIFADHETLFYAKVAGVNNISYCIFSTRFIFQ